MDREDKTSPSKFSRETHRGNVVIGILFLMIGLPMAITKHGGRSTIMGSETIDGSQAEIAGIGFCLWGLVMLGYTITRRGRAGRPGE
jgi:drug/metabolite transporter (DMT)-like permease